MTTPTPNVRARVLIVEDDRDQQELMMLLIEQFGCTCETAGSVEEAKARLNGQTFDLVVTDYDLGDGTARELIEGDPNPRRFIVVTAHQSVPVPRTVPLFRKPLQLDVFRRSIMERLQQALGLLPRTTFTPL